MTLITRISRLFRADVHAVLDRIEEPAVLLRQAVREMEEALAADERRLRRLTREEQQLAARLEETELGLSRIAEELDICFAAGTDDLARALIRRRLEAERLGERLIRRRDELKGTRAALGHRIDEHRTQLDGMRHKAELLAAREEDFDDCRNGPAAGPVVRDEDVEVAFLREKQRRQSS